MRYNFNITVEDIFEYAFILVFVDANRHGRYYLGVFEGVEGLYYKSTEKPVYNYNDLDEVIEVDDYNDIVEKMNATQLEIFTSAVSVCRLYLETGVEDGDFYEEEKRMKGNNQTPSRATVKTNKGNQR